MTSRMSWRRKGLSSKGFPLAAVKSEVLWLSANPPMDRDGWREDSGRGEGVTGAMIRARIRVDGRLAGGLQALLGAPMAAYSWLWRARWRDRTRQEALADWAGASLRGRWVGWWVSGGRVPSGWEWNGSQSGQGAAELLLPGPAPGKMQGQSACRAGDPSGQGKDPSSEGLGGHDLLTQADAGCPAGQVVGHHLYRQPGAVGGEAARGEMVQPDAVTGLSPTTRGSRRRTGPFVAD